MNTLINTMNTAYKNTSILFFASLLFFLTHSPLNAATMVFDSGFESGNLTGFAPHVVGGTFKTITSPVASGKYGGELDLQFVSAEADNYRAETRLSNGKGNFNYNTEYWFSFNYRFENWAKDSDTEFAPLQIHLKPSTWDCELGSAWSNAPLYMYVANDTMNLNTWPATRRWSAPIQKNKWLTITVRFIPSWGSNGVIEAWFNGTKIVSVSGQNHPRLDGCGKDHREPYFNMGIYKWNWRKGRPATQSTRRTLLVDNLKIAQGSNGYSMVTSATTQTTAPTPIQDTTPPAISNVQAAVTDTTATITWNTNEASSSLVQYGATTSYGSNASDSLSVTSHSVTLQNLTSNSLYHYKVSSKDSSGNTGSGTDLTFTTNRPAGEELVAYWPIDPGTGTTLPDLSGNGHTGTLVNGALLTTSGGVKFDGVNDYANVGKFDIAGKAMSISAWVWSDSLSNCSANSCRIIAKAIGNKEQDQYFMVSPITVGSATRLRFLLKVNGVTSTLTAATGNLSNKVWFHVAAVYDGTTMRLYKDGVEVGSMAKSGSITTNSNAFVWIGGNPPHATARPWKGQIDDVSLYSYALTKEEIAELAQ